jgi:uncharacterized protein YbjT (DUF2867 family)
VGRQVAVDRAADRDGSFPADIQRDFRADALAGFQTNVSPGFGRDFEVGFEMSTVLVTGGTGTLGREVVRALADGGHRPRIASRHPRPAGRPLDHEWATVDYRSGAGLADALADVDAVVLATSAFNDARLVRAVADAARPDTHLVYISIVGIDDIPMPYYERKLAAEQAVVASGRPWTILRATQFHDLALGMVRALAKPPVLLVPRGLAMQPVSAAEVGARLAALAVAEPAGRVPDLGGPEVLGVEQLARAYLEAAGISRRIVPVPAPGRMMRALAAGSNLTPEHADGRQTFAQFLAERVRR